MELKVTPPAAVWIDGAAWKGKGDRIEGLSAGEEHKIVLSADGYTPKTVTFTAKAGETRVLEERLLKLETGQQAGAEGGPQAKVRVRATGGFCDVVVNGAAVGPTPVEAVVKPGSVRISCKATDGKAQSQTVRVAAGDIARVSFALQ